MGNCVALSISNKGAPWDYSSDQKILRVVKVDGKVLEYRASVLVRDILSNFDGFGVAASRGATQCLPPAHELRIGRVYYLLPFSASFSQSQGVNIPGKDKDTEKQTGSGKRIKVVLTKQQLQELLSKSSSFEEVLCGLRSREPHVSGYATSWKPKLETIPEGRE